MKSVYMGIDSGSASVKIALVDERENLVGSIYKRNKGLVETVQQSLKELSKDNGEYKIKGVGITGSGRNFVQMFVGGDLTKTEVLAHTIGVLKYYPKVKVISDIGGEDSKLMLINEEVLNDSILNNSCSSGTGSSLEAIATRIGVPIEQVGDLALQSTKRLNISTKCGIFMQSAVVTHLNSGQRKEDILMGVVRGLVGNYLTMAQNKDLQPPHIYTGMTARNKAIVQALNESLGYEVIVPEYAPIMGAIGIALMAKREGVEKTNFKGFDLADRDYTTKSFISKRCENQCEITKFFEDGKYFGSLGHRCDECLPK